MFCAEGFVPLGLTIRIAVSREFHGFRGLECWTECLGGLSDA